MPATRQAATAFVDVWWIPRATSPEAVAGLAAVLSQDELEDVCRRRRGEDRDALTVSRAALRMILGSYLGLDPAEIPLLRRCRACGGGHGRPTLPEGLGAIYFSLSRTSGHAIVAVADVPVGVDVETVRANSDLDLIVRGLPAAERRGWEALPAAERSAALFRLWTRKEAYVKGRGEGLNRDLRDFVVTVPPEPPQLVSSAAGDAGAWILVELTGPAGPAVAATVAAKARELTCTSCSWAPDARARAATGRRHPVSRAHKRPQPSPG